MKAIKSIIRLNCDEEIDVKYFSEDGSITDTTLDYSELLEYINEIEDKNERLNSIIKEVRENIKKSSLGCDLDESETFFIKNDLLEILDKEGE